MPAAAAHDRHALLRAAQGRLSPGIWRTWSTTGCRAIERKTGYSLALIQKTIAELRKLKPKPGPISTTSMSPNVTPDVFVELATMASITCGLGGRPHAEPAHLQLLQATVMNGRRRSRTRTTSSGRSTAPSGSSSRSSSAATRSRAVAQSIVDYQTEFLNKGPEFIEPLKMQQIADKVGVQSRRSVGPSTTNGSQTPPRYFPLKRFFGGGTVSASGEEVAWDTVRLKLQDVIDHE